MMPKLASWLLSVIIALPLVADGWLGVYLDPEHDAPRVREFVPGSPAEKAGMKAGDIILAIDETFTADVAALLAVLRTTQAGQTVAVRVLRDDKERTLNVTLGAKPEGSGVPADPAPSEPSRKNSTPPSPAEESQEPSKPSSRPRLGCALADEDGRVLVTRVESGSPAARAGIQVGDVLLRVNDTAIDSGRRVAELLAQSAGGARLSLVVLRKGEEADCVVELAPVAAAQSMEPVQPMEPAPPMEPVQPMEPAEPIEPAQPSDPWLRDHDAAFAAAEEAGLQVFVVYGAERDAKTQAQLRAIESPRVQQAANGYVVVYVDRDEEPELFDAKKFARLPAFEIVRSGEAKWRHDGFLPASAVVAALRSNRSKDDDAGLLQPLRSDASAPRIRGELPLQGIEELRAEIESLRAEVETLRAEIAAMRSERSKELRGRVTPESEAPRARRE